MENGTRMKRIASQTQMVADFFLGFSSSGGVAEGRGGFFFWSTELHGVGHRVAQCLYLRVFARNRIICESVVECNVGKFS